MARPREFDHEVVISKVMTLFWEKGFKGTSLDDIVSVTGLKKGSLYASFGNKEELFKLALNKYLTQGAAGLKRKVGAIETLCQFYNYIIQEATGPSRSRRGCLVFNSCLEFGNRREPLSDFVLAVGKKREAFFREMLLEARQKGEIPVEIEPESAAQRAFATAFTIREMSKFKPEKNFLCDLANSYLASIGVNARVAS